MKRMLGSIVGVLLVAWFALECPSAEASWDSYRRRHRTNIEWSDGKIAGRVRCLCSDCTICDGRGWFYVAEIPDVQLRAAALARALKDEQRRARQ